MKLGWIAALAVALVLSPAGEPRGAQIEGNGGIAFEEAVSQGIAYGSGGVGLGERKAMKGIEKKYNLKLIFAAASGEYVASVKVVVAQGGARVLEVVSEGPWFLVKLPEGTYQVTATWEGESQVRDVKMGKAMQWMMFHWKE
jgi:hypothetical protein